jgi:RHS repeat-associated protein
MSTASNPGRLTTYVPDSVHPHAVDELTGATTIDYEYDLNGAMETRGTEGLTYDAQQRLIDYNGTETYVYTTSNQRLIRQAGGTRTLYLPGMEVSVTGTTRTINCYLTIGVTQIGTKTKVGGGAPSYMWSCGNMQNSNVCQVTADSNTIPQRKRYTPYGASRQAVPVTFPNTDRGFLNQPQDANGLVYLNNRYHDSLLGHFITVDPLVGKTGQPYLYANGAPATLTDPSGLDPGWAHDSDPCNDADYYKCTTVKGGESPWV